MIVVLMSQDMFVVAAAFAHVQLAHQTAAIQEPQSSINRGSGYPGMTELQTVVEVFGIEMIMMPIDFFEYFAPGGRHLLPGLAQEFHEFVLFGTQRSTWLTIDSASQYI